MTTTALGWSRARLFGTLLAAALAAAVLARYGPTAAELIAHIHIPLFVSGARTSTWAMLILFANLALYRRSLRPLVAGFVWLVGFEAAWLITLLALGRPGRLTEFPPAFAFIAVGVPAVWYAGCRGLHVSLPLAAATAVVWLLWLATGFHFNEHNTVGLNVTDEVLNEAAKTLWALAYFVPLLRKPRWLRTPPAPAPRRSLKPAP